MLEPLSLSVVPIISSFQCSSAGDFLATHAPAAHDRRSKADLAASSSLSTLAKNSWKCTCCCFNKYTQIHRADGKGHPYQLQNLRPAAPSPNHSQKHGTSWWRSRAPHRRSTAISKRSRTYHSFKQRLTLQTGPAWTRKHESEGKGHVCRTKPCCCVTTNPFAGKVPSSLQIRNLERTTCTHAERSSLIPLWVLCSLNSKHSWRKAANTKSLN